MHKIVTILGARPQFIKAAVLSRIIAENNEFEEVIIHTGQHFDSNMSKVFFDEMDIPVPKYYLGINNLGHGAMTGRMLEEIDKILLNEKPDIVIVYGDTNSTLAGALSASKQQIRVVHVEAGLRSFNMNMPEEINRILTDRISDLLICPTVVSMDNLRKEGFDHMNKKILQCGDIMKDAVEYYSAASMDKSAIIKNLNLMNRGFVLATIHRQENTDDPEILKSIFDGLGRISEQTLVVIPIHPRTKKKLKGVELHDNILMIDPVSYFDMLELLKNCLMVISDSGGLQKEAFYNKKHCIIARKETEWLELVAYDFALLVGSDNQKMTDAYDYFKMKQSDFSIELYGNQVGPAIYKELRKLV